MRPQRNPVAHVRHNVRVAGVGVATHIHQSRLAYVIARGSASRIRVQVSIRKNVIVAQNVLRPGSVLNQGSQGSRAAKCVANVIHVPAGSPELNGKRLFLLPGVCNRQRDTAQQRKCTYENCPSSASRQHRNTSMGNQTDVTPNNTLWIIASVLLPSTL